MKVVISKVDNGWVVELQKQDFVTKQMEITITVHTNFPAVLAYLEKEV